VAVAHLDGAVLAAPVGLALALAANVVPVVAARPRSTVRALPPSLAVAAAEIILPLPLHTGMVQLSPVKPSLHWHSPLTSAPALLHGLVYVQSGPK